MATNKYKNGKIYQLVNDVDSKVYVGSTTSTLTKRKSEHKNDAKIQTERRVYKHLNTVGWDNVKIVLIETYPCNSKDELNARERHWILKIKPELNKNLPCRTVKEYYTDNTEDILEKQKEYRETNKEVIADKQKDYYDANKEVIAQQKKEYYEANKEVIARKYVANKEERILKAKQYYEANKEDILARRREKRALKRQDE